MSKYIISDEKNGDNGEIIIFFFFCLGLIVKQLYLLPNGTLQIGDIFMLIAAMMLLFKGDTRLEIIDYTIGAFVLLATFINCIYYFYYHDVVFLKYAAFLIFSLIIIWVIRQLTLNLHFIEMLRRSCFLAVWIQTLIALFGFGHYTLGSRYIGTFNDPNQLAFYVFSVSLCGYTCGVILEKETNIMLLIPTVYLIFKSSSMSMIFGFLVFLACAYLNPRWANVKNGYIYLLFLIILLLSYLLFNEIGLLNRVQYFSLIKDSVLWHRTTGKIEMADGGGFISAFIRDRSMSRILENPIFLLFGAGEGRWQRYIQGNEIHCTMIALLYYYGIVPYCTFLKWIINNIKGIKNELIPVYIAIILEAFTLANHRQPTFWMLFVLASVPRAKREFQQDYDNRQLSIRRKIYIKQ